MAKAPQKLTPQQIENDYRYRMRRLDVIAHIGYPLAILLGVAAIVYAGIYLPISASSGKETSITFVMKWIADLKLHVWIAWGAAAAMAAGWRLQHKRALNERVTKDKRIAELEILIDPDRTSTNMNPSGTRLITGDR